MLTRLWLFVCTLLAALLSFARGVQARVLAFVASSLGIMLSGAASAQATPPDFTTLTGAVDFSTAITAILAVFALVAAVYVVWKGGTLILAAIRRR